MQRIWKSSAGATALIVAIAISLGSCQSNGASTKTTTSPTIPPGPTAACVALRADLDQWTDSYNQLKDGTLQKKAHPGISDQAWISAIMQAYTPQHLAEKQQAYHSACE